MTNETEKAFIINVDKYKAELTKISQGKIFDVVLNGMLFYIMEEFMYRKDKQDKMIEIMQYTIDEMKKLKQPRIIT